MKSGLLWTGRLLMLVGGAIAVAGIVLALLTLADMYQGVLDDPLASEHTSGESEPEGGALRAMLRWAIIGAAGLPLYFAGFVMARMGKRKARLR